jgi:hypothetical protein
MRNYIILFILAMGCANYQAQTKFNGFGNINANLASDGIKNTKTDFELGEFDLFITSKMDKVYFLSELVIALYGEDFAPDMERLILGYKFNDEFQIEAGKVHIPIGFWNNRFHHGLTIQPTISRPNIINFEDEGGGFIPIHQVGVLAKGSKLTDYNIGYNLLVSNGISSNNTKEINNHKAITAKLYAEPMDGLEVSISGMYDKLDSGNINHIGTEMTKSTTYNMIGAGVSFFNIEKSFEMSAEYYFMRAKNDIYSDNVSGGFLYMGYNMDKYKLYTLGNLIMVDQKNPNPFFDNRNRTNLTLGANYQVDDMAVLKLEFTNNFNTQERQQEIKLQFAIGF